MGIDTQESRNNLIKDFASSVTIAIYPPFQLFQTRKLSRAVPGEQAPNVSSSADNIVGWAPDRTG